MSTEQDLLSNWHFLPQDKQEEVLDFAEFLHLKNSANKTPLGERLRQIRAKIVASGKQLLDEDEIEKELASRTGGLESAVVMFSGDREKLCLSSLPYLILSENYQRSVAFNYH